MKRSRAFRILAVCVVVILAACGILSRFGHFSINLPVEHKAEFQDEALARYPAQLHVAGNQIVDAGGQVVVLKGVMVPDPAVLRGRGLFDRELFAGIAAAQANVIRIPVHPEKWVRDEDYLWRYLDPIVRWAGEFGLYVIIDWHYIGNVATGAGEQMPDIEDPPKALTLAFWELTARYFRGAPNVLFEIFNEPQSIEAEVWRANAAEIVQHIRAQDASQIIIVGGVEFGRDLSWVIEDPIPGENVAYASHIYPIHSKYEWGHWFGEVAARYPVLITEWGFMDENRDAGPAYLAGDEKTYGAPLLKYLDERGVGWVACWYDDEWLPTMLTEDRQGYTRSGEFILRALSEPKAQAPAPRTEIPRPPRWRSG